MRSAAPTICSAAAAALTAASLAMAAPARPAGALRGLAVHGRVCWAVGDAGTAVRSDDGGRTWRRLAVPPETHYQAVRATPNGVFLFGGQAVPGHPRSAGLGTILATFDGGTTFHTLPAPAAGWLYGGAFAGQTGVVFGQANYVSRTGIYHTISLGKFWNPASVYSRGFVLDGDFHTPRYGYLVGQDHRIVSLRNLAEPRFHPPRVRSSSTLRAVRLADAGLCWCVGDNGAIFRSRPTGQPWDPIALPLPPAVRRGADLEALAFASTKRAWVAGGLIGVVAATETGGGKWTLLPAPGPGAIHALAWLGGDGLLAAGDAGRIWRSEDAGTSWRLVHGRATTDVLFVVAAGDWSVWPAVAAHARAGLSVAVLFATAPPGDAGTPPDQPLRAAAAVAGADSAATLSEFPSVAADPAADLTEQDILRRWSEPLEAPAGAEMIRQIAAAIRLYRPLVLAVGPDGEGARGRLAECRLVSRFAQQATIPAGRKGALPGLAAANLPPWSLRRTFVGVGGNERWAPPWQAPPRGGRGKIDVAFSGVMFPNDDALPLGLIAQRAVWRLPGAGLLDRPGQAGAYRCEELAGRRLRLFTSGLTDRGRLRLSVGRGGRRELATMASLRMAAATGQTHTAAVDIASALADANSEASAVLAADRLLLAWWRLLEEGSLTQADQALSVFLRKGRYHPLSQRFDVLALATAVSQEWRIQLRRHGLPTRMKLQTLQKAVAGYAEWAAWSLTPAGRLLHGKALAATGQLPAAKAVYRKLAAEAYPLPWRRCAMLELGSREMLEAAVRDRPHAAARFVAEPARFDGRLDEPAWAKARLIPLQPHGARAGPGPVIQVVRSARGYLLLAARLPAATGRHWRLELAVDSDRDAWTQIVFRCETRGTQSARVATRDGPAAALPTGTFLARGQKGKTEWTLEIAVPLPILTTRPDVAATWYFQARATAQDMASTSTWWFAPQSDGRLLPERYGLLTVPNATPAKPTPDPRL